MSRVTAIASEEIIDPHNFIVRFFTELGAIGRNINQIARALSGGGELPGSMRVEFSAMLKICEAMRDNTKELLRANLASWAAGHTGIDR